MTDAEILDALEQKRWCFNGFMVYYNIMHGGWFWYDSSNAPNHKGWTKANNLRDALTKFIKSYGKT